MTTLKATMNLMALLKAGATIEMNGSKFLLSRGMIYVYRRDAQAHSGWRLATSFQGDKAGLEQAIEYVNLPI